MRLLFLSNLFPPYDLGGYEQWAREIAGRLQQRGHGIRVLTSRYRLRGSRPPEDATFDVRRALYLQAEIDYYNPLHFFSLRKRQERQNLILVREAIETFQPDLVLVWGMWNLTRKVARQAEQLMPGRVAYFISSYWPEDLDPHHLYWSAPEKKIFARVLKAPASALAKSILARESGSSDLDFAHVRCCSAYVRDRLVSAGALPAHARVLYGGIDPEPFERAGHSPGDGRLRLLYFGSLTAQKGVLTALKALVLLRDAGLEDSLQLTILGSGHPGYELRLRQFVQRYGLRQLVRFKQRIPRAQIPEQLAEHDVFLFTSVWPEPMARAVMEAMAAGLLVIGTEVGGQVEMLENGRNALTYPAGDAQALAAQIRTALEQTQERRLLALEGRKSVLERFTLQRMTVDMEVWLREIRS